MAETDERLDKFFNPQTDLQEALETHLKYCQSNAETREAIRHLIQYRQLLRDAEVERLEAETTSALERLQELEGELVLEEIRHFKDILVLHRRLLELNGPR